MKQKEISFLNEKEGQMAFFEKLGVGEGVSLSNNTDGVYKGTLFEFKLTISDINKVLFQSIKYLSHMRIKGLSIPKTILLLGLNQEIAYKFDSKDFIKEIEEIYFGASSKDNKNFSTSINPETIKYKNSPSGIGRLTQILEDEGFIKIHIDIYDVVGWANRFYLENPQETKTALFNELKNPKHFKKLIYPWKGKESDFKYILDLLNDRMHRKELGAFYTPPTYCKKSLELVRKAIKQIPKENDYVIVDRCAGTGNLEEFLTDKNVKDIIIGEVGKYIGEEFKKKYLKDKSDIINTFYSNKVFNEITLGELEKYKTNINIYNYLFDNEISHCIVATYELKEWIVLYERIGDKVKMIIPPKINPDSALVEGGDALAIEIFEEIKQYIEDKNCNIILFENPPYRDSSGSNIENEKNKTNKGKFIFEKMKGDLTNLQNSNISTARDISNQFIWSAWKYYLKKENDCYILFSPVKYWKSIGLVNKKFIEGYLFNREHFHAGASAISCICWQNIDEESEKILLQAFDIDTKNNLDEKDDEIWDINKSIEILKVKTTLTPYYEKRKFPKDEKNGIYSESSGYEANRKTSTTAFFNDNILGYIFAGGFSVDAKHITLVRTTIFNGRGFYLREDNFLEKLPLFCAKLYPQKNWYERDIYFTTADGKSSYTKDKNFLKSCLIYTCLSQRNHCLSFEGSDKRFYQNELCFDVNTLVSKILKKYKLNKFEQDLIKLFEKILKEAKKTKNYNSNYKYGIYQIEKELNTCYKKEEINIYDYPELNTKLIELKRKLSDYYETTIQSKLFEYQLLK